MTKVYVDFESRSTVDLRKTGVYPYAADKTTDLWCMAWTIDDGPVGLWVPGDKFPELPLDAEYWAHNANFERTMWRLLAVERYGFPSLPMDSWHCSAAQCAAMGLPRGLDGASKALGLSVEKDSAGHALMRIMAKPHKDGTWHDDPEDLQRLYDYCRQDVEVERLVEEYTRCLSSAERHAYLMDQRMNDRGILFDTKLVQASREIVLQGVNIANEIISSCTNGDVQRVTQVARIRKWLHEQGHDTDGLNKAQVAELLTRPDLSDHTRQVLEARVKAGKSSVTKLNSIVNGLSTDQRVRGLMLYHGAHTGRWAGRRVQPQNFPRPTVDSPEEFIDIIMNPEADYYDMASLGPNPIEVISSLLRGMIVGSPELMVGDYSSIEAIVLAWLADEETLLERFDQGEDVYTVEGETVGATRQHGKAIILGCGYGMGAKRFVDNSKEVFGLDINFPQAKQFVNGYRYRYDKIPKFWRDLQTAFVEAMYTPKKIFTVGKLTVICKGRYVWIRLPSGRPLCYHRPEVEKEYPYDLSIMRTSSLSGKMGRRKIWGGVLVENVTQAVARDVMVEGMKRLEAKDYLPILTVHDEIICEPAGMEPTLDEFIGLMTQTPEWAEGLPINADGFQAARYRKG